MAAPMSEDYEMTVNKDFGVRAPTTLFLPHPAFAPPRSRRPSLSPSEYHGITHRNMAFNLASYLEPTTLLQHSSSEDFPKYSGKMEEDLAWIFEERGCWIDHHDPHEGVTAKTLPLRTCIRPTSHDCDGNHSCISSLNADLEFMKIDDDVSQRDDGCKRRTKKERAMATWSDPCTDPLKLPLEQEQSLIMGELGGLTIANRLAESSRTALSKSLLLLVTLVRNAVLR